MHQDALVLIDIQVGFDNPIWGDRNNPSAEERAAALLSHWRDCGRPVIHIRHISIAPNSPLVGPGAAFKPEVTPLPEEVILEKSVNSGFIGTGLQAHLETIGVTRLTICGLTTPHCVSTTTRMAANLGFKVTVVEDACAAFTTNSDTSFDDGPALSAQDIHRTALAHLHGEFAEVVQSQMLLHK